MKKKKNFISIKNKFENLLMKKGKKQLAKKIFQKTLKRLQKETKKSSLDILKLSFINDYMILFNKTLNKKKKFKTALLLQKQIPYILKKQKRIFFSITNLINKAKKKTNSFFFLSLKEEIILSSSIKDPKFKYEIYKTAYLNKSFAHYRWFT